MRFTDGGPLKIIEESDNPFLTSSNQHVGFFLQPVFCMQSTVWCLNSEIILDFVHTHLFDLIISNDCIF